MDPPGPKYPVLLTYMVVPPEAVGHAQPSKREGPRYFVEGISCEESAWSVSYDCTTVTTSPIEARTFPTRTHSGSGPTFTTALPVL